MRSRAPSRWTGVAVLIAATLLFHHSFRIDCVSGNSMEPTFRDGDWLLVAKVHAGSPAPRRGDLVIARTPAGLLVKRIVGLPGEAVEVIDGTVLIDGRPQATGAPREQGRLRLSRGNLLDGRYALLGDHRDETPDAVEHAVVGRGDLVGRVVGRLLSRSPRVPAGPRTSTAGSGTR